jgi:hypothetical protein
MSKWKRRKGHRISRKDEKWGKSADWSRMIHKWWVIDLSKRMELRNKLHRLDLSNY